MNLEKYAIYLRKSRADIEAEKYGEGETLSRHKNILTDLAKNKSLNVTKVYQEIVSGETIKDRPKIQELIKDCYDGQYKGILVVDVTRLSRGNQADAQTILDCIKYSNKGSGLLIITPTKTYNVAKNQDDEEYMEFELFMSRREYKMIQKRMDRGRRQAVIEGNFMGSHRPYGYNIIKNKRSRTLIPNEDEAPVVKMIFDLAIKENLSAWKIAKHLTDLGIPTYSGNGEWSRDTITTILTNPVYTGRVRWNYRKQIKEMKNGNIIKTRPRPLCKEDYMLYEGKHKKYALIDDETYKLVSDKFKIDKTKYHNKLSNPLATILVCKKCGKAMIYHKFKNRKGVKPRYVHRQSSTCFAKSTTAENINNELINVLVKNIENFSIETNINNFKKEDRTIKELQDNINKIELKINKLFDAWENCLITDEEFNSRKELHTKNINRIKLKIEKVKEHEYYAHNKKIKINTFYELIQCLKDPNMPAESKNKFFKTIIDKIEYTNNENITLDVIFK